MAGAGERRHASVALALARSNRLRFGEYAAIDVAHVMQRRVQGHPKSWHYVNTHAGFDDVEDEANRMNRAKRLAFMAVLVGILAGCGTALSCNNEFGAPPEREFWCAPIDELGKYFRVQDARITPEEEVECVESLGQNECYPKTAQSN